MTADRSRVPVGGSVRVAVQVAGGSPTGVVRLAGGAEVATGTLVGGRASLVVPAARLGAGSHRLTASYAGDGGHAASTGDVAVTVVKASSTTRVTAARKGAKAAKVRVTVRSTVAVTGTVKVVVRKGAKAVVSRTVALRRGSATLTLPRLAAGRYRATASYAGSPSVASSGSTTTLRVTRPRGR